MTRDSWSIKQGQLMCSHADACAGVRREALGLIPAHTCAEVNATAMHVAAVKADTPDTCLLLLAAN